MKAIKWVSWSAFRQLRKKLGVLSQRRRLAVLSRLRSTMGINNPKIFCVGQNKTGTTSMAAALTALGYQVGRQRDAELLIEDWGKRDFRKLIAFCHSADAFQDVPFSHDYTFQSMDMAFPGSKFILTVRDTPEQWYGSLVRFHTKRLAKGRLPTPDDLKNDPYVFKGWTWRNYELVWGPEEHALYNKELYIAHYVRHNERIQDYFRHRPDDLLILNLAKPNTMRQLCDFLGIKWDGQQMPILNKSN